MRCAVAVLWVCLASSVGIGQKDTIRVDTSHVTVPVTVVDRDGRYVTGLRKNDFRVFEGVTEQEISIFETHNIPISVLLLLDTSGSMMNSMRELARASAAFVKELRPDDRLAIATFSDDSKLHFVLEPTVKKDFREVISLRPAMGDSFTTTFNAVDLGIKYMAKLKGRRAIVLLSDGEMYGRGASAKGNLRDAEEQEAIIYTVRFGKYPDSQPGYQATRTPFNVKKYGNALGLNDREMKALIAEVDAYMLGLAERTGGRGFHIDAISDLAGAFRLIAGELSQQYTLGYSPREPGKPGERRRIQVRVSVPNAAVRSRNEVVYTAK